MRDEAFDTKNESELTFREVLESESVPKVLFDVRNDADALFAHFRISLRGVHDLQLMEIATRKYPKKRLVGLARCIEYDIRLSSSALEVWKPTKAIGKIIFAPQPESDQSQDIINVRSMRPEVVAYCVNDLIYLPILWQTYNARISRPWALRVEVETLNRLRMSQDPSYDPRGGDRTKSPWTTPFPLQSNVNKKNLIVGQQSLEVQHKGKSTMATGQAENEKGDILIQEVNVSAPFSPASIPRYPKGMGRFQSADSVTNLAMSSQKPGPSTATSKVTKPPTGPSAHSQASSTTGQAMATRRWICRVCSRDMQRAQRDIHLASHRHRENVRRAEKFVSRQHDSSNEEIEAGDSARSGVMGATQDTSS